MVVLTNFLGFPIKSRPPRRSWSSAETPAMKTVERRAMEENFMVLILDFAFEKMIFCFYEKSGKMKKTKRNFLLLYKYRGFVFFVTKRMKLMKMTFFFQDQRQFQGITSYSCFHDQSRVSVSLDESMR